MYFVVLLVTYSDDTKNKVAIYTYDDKDSALAGCYKYLGQYVNAENVATACVECKSALGVIYKNEVWTPSAANA